jgi:hypothetical protein
VQPKKVGMSIRENRTRLRVKPQCGLFSIDPIKAPCG